MWARVVGRSTASADMDKREITDQEAMEAIHALLSGKEWTSETLDMIAALVRLTGRAIRDIGVED